MNGGHILLIVLLGLALLEIIYANNRLADARRGSRMLLVQRDAARRQADLLRSERDVSVLRRTVVCESCGNEDATFQVCTDCMTAVPDAVYIYNQEEGR